MMTERDNVPLSELLRPRTLEDLTLPTREIERLQKMMDTNNPMSMLLYGPPGSGKTSTARLFLASTDLMDTLRMDGSSQTGVDQVRDVIDRFASRMSWSGGLKLCVIDESDFLSKNAQASLRGVIERYASHCRFIMTANDLSKIMPAIRSRMLCLSFAISHMDRSEIQKRFENRLAERLTELKVAFDRKRLDKIVANYFPDFRQIACRIEYEC
jgi:replication-associated recombination protein RarA